MDVGTGIAIAALAVTMGRELASWAARQGRQEQRVDGAEESSKASHTHDTQLAVLSTKIDALAIQVRELADSHRSQAAHEHRIEQLEAQLVEARTRLQDVANVNTRQAVDIETLRRDLAAVQQRITTAPRPAA